MKYTIIVNEEQRNTMYAALRGFNAEFPGHETSEELEGMLECLPQDEAEDPGCVHDFTL